VRKTLRRVGFSTNHSYKLKYSKGINVSLGKAISDAEVKKTKKL
jgi:hypothetical protein